jgi:hypothetical protein
MYIKEYKLYIKDIEKEVQSVLFIPGKRFNN